MRKLIELDAALEGLENLNAISFYEVNEHSKEAYMETKDMLKALPTVDAVPVVRCKDCSKWCICYHSDNWFCADGTPINTASDFYDDKGKRLNNPKTYKSIYGERKDHETDKR